MITIQTALSVAIGLNAIMDYIILPTTVHYFQKKKSKVGMTQSFSKESELDDFDESAVCSLVSSIFYISRKLLLVIQTRKHLSIKLLMDVSLLISCISSYIICSLGVLV